MNKPWIVLLSLAFTFQITNLFGAEKTTTPVLSASSLELERQKLEIERMKLENEKMKWELEKAKAQATQGPQPENSEKKETEKKEDVKVYQAQISKKAEDLSKQNKEKENILVIDFANAEFWHHGVRYSLHELYSLAQDQKWTINKSIAARANNGYPRYLYRLRNISLLRYQGRDRGIVEINLPVKGEDFQIVTPEGFSFDSSIGDVRNACQNLYFSYERQYEKENENLHVLRYKHSTGSDFDDLLDVFLNKESKVVRIRYGVLGEH